LERAAKAGLPPPAPTPPEGDPWDFTYSWVEIGKKERATLELSNAAKGGQRWEQAAKARADGVPFVIEYAAGGDRGKGTDGTTSLLVWSRPTENTRLSPAEREAKGFDYFMLVRNPTAPDAAITGNYLINAQVGEPRPDGVLPVEFTFNARGGQLFYAITTDNQPLGKEPNRNYAALAIILDGQIVSAPTINSPIGERGEISGKFKAEEARNSGPGRCRPRSSRSP
jgi:hypothetical protein